MSKTPLQIKDILQTEIRSPSSPENFDLPSQNIVKGQEYKVINTGTAIITVRSSNGSTLHSVDSNSMATFVALQATPTTASHWFVVAPSYGTSSQAGLLSVLAQTFTGKKTFNSYVRSVVIQGGQGVSGTSSIAPAAGRCNYLVFVSSNFSSGDSVRGAIYHVLTNNEGTAIAAIGGNPAAISNINSQSATFSVSGGFLQISGLSAGNNQVTVIMNSDG